jgi:GT2 family glycosyltransferase
MRLSIIIVTYNAGDIFFECLRRLDAADCEIIVVDNHSQDGTPQRIAESYPHIRLIANTDNPGFASANNQGLSVAQGDYLLLLNPDVLINEHTLPSMIEVFETHSDAGVVGARTYDNNGEIALTAHASATPGRILWQYLGFHRLLPGGKYRHAVREASGPFQVGWVGAHCLMFRREVYAQIGGLDGNLFLFMEDPDFCDRAIHQGWKVYCQPSATVIHQESTTISRYPLVKMRHYHLSPLHYFRKRNQAFAVMLLKLGFTLELALKFGARLLQFAIRRDDVLRARLAAYPIVIREVWQF